MIFISYLKVLHQGGRHSKEKQPRLMKSPHKRVFLIHHETDFYLLFAIQTKIKKGDKKKAEPNHDSAK